MKYALFAAFLLVHTTIAQDIVPECGNEDRTTVISNDFFASANIASTILPALRDTICGSDAKSYCGSDRSCSFSTVLRDGSNEPAQITMNRTDETPDGRNGQLGPCPTAMDQIFAQCISGDSPKTFGSARIENIFYSITVSRAPALFDQTQLQSIFNPGDVLADVKIEVPEEFHPLLEFSNDEPVEPPTEETGDISPQCQRDCVAIQDKVTSKAGGRDGQICTGNPANFIDQGSSADGNSDFFRVDSNNNCHLMVAKSGLARGHSGEYCFAVADLINFVGSAAGGCALGNFFANISQISLPAQSFNSGLGMVCLADEQNFKKCGEGVL